MGKNQKEKNAVDGFLIDRKIDKVLKELKKEHILNLAKKDSFATELWRSMKQYAQRSKQYSATKTSSPYGPGATRLLQFCLQFGVDPFYFVLDDIPLNADWKSASSDPIWNLQKSFFLTKNKDYFFALCGIFIGVLKNKFKDATISFSDEKCLINLEPDKQDGRKMFITYDSKNVFCYNFFQLIPPTNLKPITEILLTRLRRETSAEKQ